MEKSVRLFDRNKREAKMQKRKSNRRVLSRTSRRSGKMTTGGITAHYGCQKRIYDAIVSWRVLEMIVDCCDRMVRDVKQRRTFKNECYQIFTADKR